MGKFTPGPWKAFNVSDVFTDRQDEFAEVYVADCSMDALTNDEVEANARLIAAAPELLSALQYLFDSYKSLADSGDAGKWKVEDLHEGQKALAAIAKATGESNE